MNKDKLKYFLGPLENVKFNRVYAFIAFYTVAVYRLTPCLENVRMPQCEKNPRVSLINVIE